MTKRNEEKFKRLEESFNKTLEKMQAMNDEELAEYIDDEATINFFQDSGISGFIDLLFFKIPFTKEELADFLDIDLNPENHRTVGIKATLNIQYLMNKPEILEHFLIAKKDEFYKSIKDYMEMKLTDNGINKKYDDLIKKLNSMEDEEFADYICKESLLESKLSGGLHGFIDGMEFEIAFDKNSLSELSQDERNKHFLIEKREDVIKSLENSKEEELKLYLESETYL